MKGSARGQTLVAIALLALLGAGCGARALTATPPSAGASHASAAGPAQTAASAPGTPIVVMPVVPAALHGRWQPVSTALTEPGALTLTAQSLTWAPCGAIPRVVQGAKSGDAVDLTLPGQTACRLDKDAFTLLRVAPQAGNACQMELSLYQNAAQVAKRERLAWGVYEREGCQPR